MQEIDQKPELRTRVRQGVRNAMLAFATLSAATGLVGCGGDSKRVSQDKAGSPDASTGTIKKGSDHPEEPQKKYQDQIDYITAANNVIAEVNKSKRTDLSLMSEAWDLEDQRVKFITKHCEFLRTGRGIIDASKYLHAIRRVNKGMQSLVEDRYQLKQWPERELFSPEWNAEDARIKGTFRDYQQQLNQFVRN